jgi:hypothetical protein
MKRALISTFRKLRCKVHVKLPLISMFERFWVLPASSKSWNYQAIAFSLLWCWKCYLTHSIMQKTARQSIIQQNNVGGIASGNWTGHQNITQWDEEFNDGVGWRLQHWTYCTHTFVNATPVIKVLASTVFPRWTFNSLYASLPLRSSNESFGFALRLVNQFVTYILTNS